MPASAVQSPAAHVPAVAGQHSECHLKGATRKSKGTVTAAELEGTRPRYDLTGLGRALAWQAVLSLTGRKATGRASTRVMVGLWAMRMQLLSPR